MPNKVRGGAETRKRKHFREEGKITCVKCCREAKNSEAWEPTWVRQRGGTGDRDRCCLGELVKWDQEEWEARTQSKYRQMPLKSFTIKRVENVGSIWGERGIIKMFGFGFF